jgi:hypothetical protein
MASKEGYISMLKIVLSMMSRPESAAFRAPVDWKGEAVQSAAGSGAGQACDERPVNHYLREEYSALGHETNHGAASPSFFDHFRPLPLSI